MYDLKISITKKCNLKCIYCHYTDKETLEEDLPFEFWKKILLEYKNLKLPFIKEKKVTITGGEALLHKDFWNILKFSKELNFYVSLPTNGTLLTSDIVKKYKELGVDDVIIAFDGNKENHEKLRGKGTFEKALKGAELIKKYGIKLLITTCLTKINYKDLPEVIKLAKDLGAKLVIIFHYISLGRGKEEFFNGELSKEEILESLFEIYTLAKKYKDSLELCTTTIPQYWVLLSLMYQKKKYVPSYFHKVFPGCRAVLDFVYITNQGKVYPCPLLQDSLGDLKEKSLKEILVSEKAKSYASRDYFKICVSCKYKSICGGCKVRKDPLCPYLLENIEKRVNQI